MHDVVMKQEKKTTGFVMIQNAFLREWVKEIGMGPAMLYLQLLSYCYGEKEMAYPSLKTLAGSMGVSVKTIVVYRKILVAYGLIKRIIRRKDEKGCYQNNLYQLVRFNRSLPQEEVDEEEPVVSEVIGAGDEVPKRKMPEHPEDDLVCDLKELGVSTSIIRSLLEQYPKEKIRRRLYLLREKTPIHSPGAYLLSVLRNDSAAETEDREEITGDEMDDINREERMARRKYYQQMEENSLPRQESLKWIRRIKHQLKNGEMICEVD